MTKKEKDIALFVAFCIEEYAADRGMQSQDVYEMFAKYNAIHYLSECYEPLHSKGRLWILDDIDHFIDNKEKEKV